MANTAVILANQGYFYTPHLVKAIEGEESITKEYITKHVTEVTNPIFYNAIADAMEDVVNRGTARRAITPGISICGKTGTIENKPYEDHSCFIAFAPKEDPKIAIAVYVENAGYGGTWAAPIASLIIEKHINDSIQNPRKEQRILEKRFINLPKEDAQEQVQ